MCQNCWTCERGVGTSKIVSMLVVSKSRMQHLRCMASASSFICAQVCQLAQSWTILRDCSFSLTAVKHRRHAGLAVASEAASVIVNMMRNLSTQASDIGTWLAKATYCHRTWTLQGLLNFNRASRVVFCPVRARGLKVKHAYRQYSAYSTSRWPRTAVPYQLPEALQSTAEL